MSTLMDPETDAPATTPCQLSPDDWFPEVSGPAPKYVYEACLGCPVKGPCLDYAMRMEGDGPGARRFGVWGGLSPRQRAELAQGAKAA